MLVRLLRQYLAPYRTGVVAVLLLQLVQTIATLYLPSLNADIIDHGVAVGDTGYIVRIGAVMLGVSLVQVACAVTAVYFGARTAMALGRDLREGLFSHVQEFSAQEVGKFGAPSLITRTTNDVQQVQMVILFTFTMMVTAPIMLVGGVVMALRQDVALSRLLLVIVPVLGVAVALISGTNPNLGTTYIISAFLVVVAGGLGQLRGTVIAAFAVGIVTAFLTDWLSSSMAQVLTFALVVIFLQARPQGLFTVRTRGLA